ncbi:3-phosphoshikimate 1-carboxyvinyltransferase [Caminibacter mediatlanticus TB-2]|uniref:3-phosphoshikimate 1-carboxyvinyltransferase n=1 Tax=Caminibacter mediatlanticus TB-2 TaxID=391592 RepID=A0ABX5VB41_9BACT|nr:3-phosphoshikimate 1-carboxyvinyltransferase [Caminibacter mediatlanticus]QCT94799.1 3-phosphoshikimate 1-carboxyvinyltransferase [Caminibacter mediatlanticus TB-2]
MILEVFSGKQFNEEFLVDADKSISHRCAIFSLLTNGENIIKNYLRAEDTLNSLEIAKKLGAKIEDNGDVIKIIAPKKIKEADDVLYCGNSGTTIRIYSGLLAGVDGFFVLTGDEYLRRRPMKRISAPLISIGAKIDGRENANLAPLSIRGGKLKSFKYESKIASAQVKSAMILAALNTNDISTYIEPFLSRDHTERMLKGMGADIECKMENGKWRVNIAPLKEKLNPLNITVPNDPSSAFFFAVAAAITNSTAIIKNVTLNQTRIEAYKVLEKMGATIEYILKEDKYEPIGDIVVKGNQLQAVEVSNNIPWLIDELPALAMAMAVAHGKSIVRGAKELRVKESDRIKAVVENLKKCGVEAKEFEDGYEIIGGDVKSALIDSFGDHRIAMSFAILGILSGMKIQQAECINTSFPNFFKLLSKVAKYRIMDVD